MIKCPLDKVVVQVDTKYHKNFSNMIKRANMNPGSQINPADYVQIIGEVVAIPDFINNRIDYKGFTTNDIYPGDIAIFRYDVIYDFVESAEGEDPIYKNMVWVKGQEYFLADIQKIFGVIRAGEIIMVNGYCMVENMSAPPSLVLPQHLKNLIRTASATITNIGNPLSHQKPIGAKPGDIVYYNPAVLQRYEINEKKFGILTQKQILGRKVGSYSDIQGII
jgi:co-chaperonin GroES (HSP10)